MSNSSDTSPSLLNNLRGFRFQKRPSLTHANDNGNQLDTSSEVSSIVNASQVSRKIRRILDSDSDGDRELIMAAATATPSSSIEASNENSNSSTSNDYADKGQQMRIMIEAFPNHDIMLLQDTLLRHGWNAQVAIHFLLENPGLKNKKRVIRSGGGASGNSVGGKKKATKRRRADVDSDDSDFGNHEYSDTRVFDSDEDSDLEISNELTGDKKRVFEFLQTASANELRLMTSCSAKKVEAILQLRPFRDWCNLVDKLRDSKHLSTDVLNSAQQVLATRSNVQQLMHRCTNLAQQMERAVAAGAGVQAQPRTLSANLHLTNYQLVGLNWLAVMHAQNVNGILADEMGLGKTVQVIAFLAHLKETGAAKGTHLIVVPSSTLDNWRAEFERWCPSLEVFVYYGSTEERRMVRIDWSRGGLMNTDVILTTYTMVASNPEERKMFRITQMHYVVFDEAHMLKNMNTQRYENLIRIKAYSRILLTGTPLQNNLLELMSLLIFVMPTMFAGKTEDLKSLFQKNGKTSGTMNGGAGDGDNELPAFEREQIAQAKRIMKPFLLRRLKRDVLQELPSKSDKMVLVSMATGQKLKYEELIRSLQNTDGQLCVSSDYSGMAMMTDMRKLSNHPLLLRYHYKYEELPKLAARLAADPYYKETKEHYIVDDLACMSDFEIHTLTKEYKSISGYKLSDSLVLSSGKFQYLDKLLEELHKGDHRVLIFSQFVIMLNVLEEYMKIRGRTYLRLDGQTPVAVRQQLIDTYSADPNIFIFLLSTKAGGLGINLTAADTVIIHDIDFNPYNDKQAEDRCHRMGQQRPVSIYRLVSKGTIEEGMFQMAQEKLKLEREITTDENESSELKSVVRLLTLALGVDSTRAATLVSNSPPAKSKKPL